MTRAGRLEDKVVLVTGRGASIVNTVIHLLSDESTFVTGQTLMVDGGTIAT
jgi:enoyl-[acyl-carrier-protein] reductase (NADH)